jgi:hypothetical protein
VNLSVQQNVTVICKNTSNFVHTNLHKTFSSVKRVIDNTQCQYNIILIIGSNISMEYMAS